MTPFVYVARLVRVVDGDTVRLELDLGFYTTRGEQPYRLRRINAPELGTVDGSAAKDHLIALLDGKVLMVETHKSDHFGRFLIELYANAVNVNDLMTNDGYAVPYMEGK